MKKRIPILVWQKIQPLLDQHRALIILVRSEQHALYLKDADPESDFYFQFNMQTQGPDFAFECKPASSLSQQVSKDAGHLEDLVKRLTGWLDILQLYATTPTIYDDPIEQYYAQEFARYIVMDDERAETIPFDLPKQLLLEQYLDQVKERLEEHRERATPAQAEQLGALSAACEQLQADQSQLTQNQTLGRLAKLWAMARKYSISLVKELLAEFKKEGIKKLVERSLNVDVADLESILGMIST